MSLQRAIGGWCRGLERDWMNIRRELPVDVEKAGARPGHARHAIAGWPYGAPAPVLATPSTATRDLTPLAVLVDHAVRDEETDNVQRYERVTIVQLTPLDLGNALECVGIPLDPASWDTMRAWLPRMEGSPRRRAGGVLVDRRLHPRGFEAAIPDGLGGHCTIIVIPMVQ